MSTRAQIQIISVLQGIDFIYGISSDGYPSRILEPLKTFDGDIANLAHELYMNIDPAGNVDYYYQINCDTNTLTYWRSQIYWRNAPEDWKERGWNCWLGKNGKYGWSEWRKGKKLEEYRYPKYLSIKIIPETKYPYKALRSLPEMVEYGKYTLTKLFKKTKDPDIIHTFLEGDMFINKCMYEIPLDEVPIHLYGNISLLTWRLHVNL